MCKLYHQTTAAEALRQLFDGLDNQAGNIEPSDAYLCRSWVIKKNFCCRMTDGSTDLAG